MKIKLLLSMLLLCPFMIQAQQITGPTTPCPNTPTTYTITVDADENIIDYSCTLIGGTMISATLGQPVGGAKTETFIISWFNNYDDHTSNGTQVPGTFTVPLLLHSGSTSRTISVLVKAIPPFDFTGSTNPLPCNISDAFIVCKSMPNVTSVAWSNSAGWPVTYQGNTNYNISANTVGGTVVKAVATNAACPGVSQTSTLGISRPGITDQITFSTPQATDICVGATVTQSVGYSGTTAVTGWDWYTVDNNCSVLLNGTAYHSSTTPLHTTANNISMSSPSGNGVTALYGRATYQYCDPGPWSSLAVNVGNPIVNGFSGSSNRTYLSTNNTPYYNVCPAETMLIFPTRSGTNRIANEWLVDSGTPGGMTVLPSGALKVSAPLLESKHIILKYRYQTACGWSPYAYVYIDTKHCDGGGFEPGSISNPLMANDKTNTLTIPGDAAEPLDFTLSPNPATTQLTVTTTTSKTTSTTVVRVLDLNGNLLSQKTRASATRFNVDLGKLTPGTYILQLQRGTSSSSKKFIVVH